MRSRVSIESFSTKKQKTHVPTYGSCVENLSMQPFRNFMNRSLDEGMTPRHSPNDQRLQAKARPPRYRMWHSHRHTKNLNSSANLWRKFVTSLLKAQQGAKVLPLPVFATPTTSRPARASLGFGLERTSGLSLGWKGVGLAVPKLWGHFCVLKTTTTTIRPATTT